MPKAKRVLRKLMTMGWEQISQHGPHRKLRHSSGLQITFAFHDNIDLGKTQLKQIAKQADCKPEDLI